MTLAADAINDRSPKSPRSFLSGLGDAGDDVIGEEAAAGGTPQVQGEITDAVSTGDLSSLFKEE